MAQQHSTTEQVNKRHKHEGPQKHIVSFIFSIVLTAIAFAMVASGELNTSFIYAMLIVMAILQVFVQMAFWMHMKDRGHLYATIGILSGVVVVITMVLMAKLLAWW